MAPDARPPAPLPQKKNPWPFLLAILAVAYGIFLSNYIGPYAGGADSSGYFNSAKLLTQGELIAPMRLPPGMGAYDYGRMLFMPLGLLDHGEHSLVPSYPPGLPLHLAAFGKFIGIGAAVYIWNLIFVLGGGALVYLLGRELCLPPAWAAAGPVVLWLNPMTLFLAVQPMSDLPAFFWCSLALLAALRGRTSTGWALLAGFSIGIAVLVRPSNVLLAVPVLIALIGAWKKMPAIAVGGLLPALFQIWYNQQIFGTPLATGYGNVTGAFLWENVWPSLKNVGLWLPAILSPLLLLGLAGSFTSSSLRSRAGAVLLAWTATLIIFYLFYYHTREHWWYLRFIYPCFAALIVIALAGAHHLFARRSWQNHWWPTAIASAALVFFLLWSIKLNGSLYVLLSKEGEARYPESARIAAATLPANAAVFCMQSSGALFYYTDLMIVRWDVVERDNLARLQARLSAQAIPIYAMLFDFEAKEALEKLGGNWTRLQLAGNATIWRKDRP